VKRILVGDVLALALDQDHHCVAQVIGTYGRGSYFIAVYDRPPVLGPASAADLTAVKDAEMALLALTLDAMIYHGAWVVVGRSEVSSRACLPGYLLDRGSPPESVRQVIVDHSGKRERPATDRDLVRVKYRTTVAPIRLDKAAKAFFGRMPWDVSYDGLLPATYIPESDLFR
jgi:hypothetical protein